MLSEIYISISLTFDPSHLDQMSLDKITTDGYFCPQVNTLFYPPVFYMAYT